MSQARKQSEINALHLSVAGLILARINSLHELFLGVWYLDTFRYCGSIVYPASGVQIHAVPVDSGQEFRSPGMSQNEASMVVSRNCIKVSFRMQSQKSPDWPGNK